MTHSTTMAAMATAEPAAMAHPAITLRRAFRAR
jgi:hypothetical protein